MESKRSTPEVRKAALAALPRIARTASHLFLFASYVEQFRGWGKGLRKAVARWYDGKEVDALAYQIEKYRSREGFSHRDLLLLAHVGSHQSGSTLTPDRAALYEHAAGKSVDSLDMLLRECVRFSRDDVERADRASLGDERQDHPRAEAGRVRRPCLPGPLTPVRAAGTPSGRPHPSVASGE